MQLVTIGPFQVGGDLAQRTTLKNQIQTLPRPHLGTPTGPAMEKALEIIRNVGAPLSRVVLITVHHLRELTFLEEEQQQAWAGKMKELLLDIKAAFAQARTQSRRYLHPLEVADWKARYSALLIEGYQANPPDPPPATSKKGRRKQSAARNLLDRLSKHQDAVLLFLDNFAVPFDNSLAERDIRMVKVQQKVSGCFRSVAFAQAFCRIRGYLSTLRKQGLAVLTALEQTLVGHPVSPAF